MQATMFLAQPKPAKRHVAQVPIKHIPVKHPVMLLKLATMFLAQPKRHKRLVLLEHTIQTLGPRVPRLVEMLT